MKSAVERPENDNVSAEFDYSLDFATIDFREHPELYRVGRGEQGVLLVEPYKSEILPHWRFRTPEIAAESAETIHAMFDTYKVQGDFVGMDMARKFLQMGWTRARRYANHRSGQKYDQTTGERLPVEIDEVKAESARIFKGHYDAVRADPEYVAMRRAWVAKARAG
jgi:hypothetical protein